MVGWFAFTSPARNLHRVGNFGKFLFPRKLGIAQRPQACFVLFQNKLSVPFGSISTHNPSQTSANLYSTFTPGGIVKSSYTVEIPDVSLNDYVLSKFDEYGDDLAMIDSASERAYTYRELKSSIIKMGSALTKRGFKKGDVFALLLPNIPEYPIFFLGVAAVGGVVTTLNPTYTAREIALQLKDSGAQYLATLPTIAGTAREAAAEAGIKEVFVTGEVDGCTPVSSLLDDDGIAFPENVQIDPKEDVCVMPYSSGTTGFPKGVMLTHHNLVSQMCMLKHDSFRAQPMRAVALAFLPFFHIFGMVVVMMAFLQRGGKIVCMIQFDGELMLKLIQDYKVNALYIAPPVATFLAKHPSVEKYNLASLDSILSGAAPLGEELTELMRSRFPAIALRQGFGLTETSPAAMLCPRNICKPGSVGVMLPNLEGKVVDLKTGETLGPNQDGEVCIRGPTVMKGYLNDPKTTAASITPEGWFHTGDVGHYDDEGHFFIVDRLKDLIKYKGFQVPPAELEALLHMHPNIYDVAVIGVPDSVAGEVPKAFVVAKGDITEGEVANFVAERVASYKKLRGGVEFVDQIPKSASGKILKRELRKLT